METRKLVTNLLSVGGAFFLCIVVRPGVTQGSPGLQGYTPTRLEWAAVELQAANGQNTATHESPLTISFVPWNDGHTVVCLLQYTDDYEATALRVTKESLAKVFATYSNSRGWTWLRLRFQEKSLGRSWPR